MTRREAVTRIVNGIRPHSSGMTACEACGLLYAAHPKQHAPMHLNERGYSFWHKHSGFLGVVPVADHAPAYLRNGGRVESWMLKNKVSVVQAGWATRTGAVLLVPRSLWDFLHDLTRRHRADATTTTLLNDMLAEALKGGAA